MADVLFQSFPRIESDMRKKNKKYLYEKGKILLFIKLQFGKNISSMAKILYLILLHSIPEFFLLQHFIQ